MASTLVRRHNETVLTTLEKGDMIEFPRGNYSHWGVYIGEGKIVHLAGDENDGVNANLNSGHLFTISGQRFNKAFVRIEDFLRVADKSMAKKNNDKDRKLKPKTREEIVEKALEMIGEIGYNLLWRNCEHFASFCRYDVEISDQVDNALTWAAVGAAVGGLAIGILGVALGSSSRSDKKDKHNVYM